MKRISLAIVALGLCFGGVASAKLVPDYRNVNFEMSTKDSVLIHIRHKLIKNLCTMYQKQNLGPVAAYLNQNYDYNNTDVAFMDKALTAFNKHIEEVPGLKKPEKDDDKPKKDDKEKKPYPTTYEGRLKEYLKKRNDDLVEQYRPGILALAKKADDLNMPEAQKRILLDALQSKTVEYLNARFGDDLKYDFNQHLAQDLQPYTDLKNQFPCLYVKDAKKSDKKAQKKDAKKNAKKADDKAVKGDKKPAPKKGN